MSWDIVRLGDVCDEDKVVANGKSSSKPYLGLDMIESDTGKIDWSINTNEGISTCYSFDSRHVLYGKLRPYLNKVALPVIEGRCSTEIIPLLPKPDMSREYIAFYLRRKDTIDYIMPENTGSRMPRADMKHLLDMEIVLPSYGEQRRIAAEIKRQLAAVEKAIKLVNEQLALAEYAKAKSTDEIISADLFKDYEWIPIKDCTSKVGSGATPRGGQSAYHARGIPLIRSQNVHFNVFFANGLAFINEQQNDELRNTVVQNDDVLLNITGASIGRVCVVPNDYCPANVNQHVCIIRLDDRFLPEFVSRYMATRDFQANIMALQAGATRQALTKEQIQDFKIPLIEKSKQNVILADIREKTESFNKLFESLSKQRDNITAMSAAILRQAFSGQI